MIKAASHQQISQITWGILKLFDNPISTNKPSLQQHWDRVSAPVLQRDRPFPHTFFFTPSTPQVTLLPLVSLSIPVYLVHFCPYSSPVLAHLLLYRLIPFSHPISVEREAAHLRVMELWQADPSALSSGRAAVPELRDAYLPKHTSTPKLQEYTHLHSYMHTFIDLPREHTCALTHTSTLQLLQHMSVCTALCKSSHFYAATKIWYRTKNIREDMW